MAGIPLPTLSEQELQERFAKIKPRMTDQEAMGEASRCLFCHDAPCINACPTSIDIPMFIRQIMTRNPKGAAKTIFTQNILGQSCADVCPTEVLCEGSCVYLGMNKNPIEIGRLQGYATAKTIDQNIHFFKKGRPSGRRVAILGAGPAGLACAHELTVLGHEAVVFEASEKAGGLNRYGVAPYKYSNQSSDREVAYVAEIGFEIKTGQQIETNALKPLEKRFDAIFIGIGLGETRPPPLPGIEKEGAFAASDFIYNLRKNNLRVPIGRRVVVIGGGNTAIDAAVESAKLGSQVTLVYRRTEDKMSAYDFEVELARQHGVQLIFQATPVEILGNKKVEGIQLSPSPLEGEGWGEGGLLSCDMVIFATGQEKQLSFLKSIPGLELENGKIKVNKDFETTNERYFAGGDCVNGGKEVVHAVAHGREAARGIDSYFKRKLL
ncbi:MAG: NAD(P)-dependent oxidoreductase [Deltaproteobacteria bacterium]|nr:NAD(P)-dependent oxidoreductase [Deltaproteobacteria bacterium]